MTLEDTIKTIQSEGDATISQHVKFVNQALLASVNAIKARVPSALEIVQNALESRPRHVGTTGSSQPKKP